ncbi:MAG: hypothetical protein ACPGUC_06595 [Gammaproteobacteria bacterium]
MSGFELYRYTHSDGTAKDWAWCEHPSVGMEVRWGRAGRLVQKATYPVAKRRMVMERALAKQRKGYRFLGWCKIDASGQPVDLRRPSTPRLNGSADRRITPTTASGPSLPRIDLSQVETGSDDYWF